MAKNSQSQAISKSSRYLDLVIQKLADADPNGMEMKELRLWAKEKGISELYLSEALTQLQIYANIYYNHGTNRFHYLWSSSIQYE